MKNPKIQHFVPKFLLRNFRFNKDDQIYVFDKKEDRSFFANIKNLASEQGFYDFWVDGEKLSIEPQLSEIESIAAVIIRKLTFQESLEKITNEEKQILASFIAIQLSRGKKTRQQILKNSRLMENWLIEHEISPKDVGNFEPIDEEGAKGVSVSLVANFKDLLPHLLDKWWLLFKTPIFRPFYISDNPVVMQNMFDYSPRGSLGLAIKGIEIYLPISRTITLALYCKSHEEYIRENIDNVIKRLKLMDNRQKSKKEKRSYKALYELWITLKSQKAIQLNEPNLENLNSLQVANSSRFLFSYTNNFDLAHKMITKNPKLREGPPLPELANYPNTPDQNHTLQ